MTIEEQLDYELMKQKALEQLQCPQKVRHLMGALQIENGLILLLFGILF